MTTLKTLRAERGLSQVQLATLAGVNRSLIQKIERGDVEPSNITLKSAVGISAALGLLAEDLLDIDPDA